MVDYKMKAGTGHFKVTGQNVQLVRAAAIKLVENNWPLIVFYFVVNVAGIGGAYFIEKWDAVQLAALVAFMSFLIGLKMIKETITITKEIR